MLASLPVSMTMIRVMIVTRKVGKKIIIISTKHQSSQRVDIRRGVENKGALLHNQAPPRSSQGNPDPLHITPLNLLWHPIPYSANSCSRLNQCRLPSGPPYPNQSHFHSSWTPTTTIIMVTVSQTVSTIPKPISISWLHVSSNPSEYSSIKIWSNFTCTGLVG